MSFLPFFKYQQSGNDFVIIDDREKLFPIDNEKLLQNLCHRRFGIGADGVILLQESRSCDYFMRIFNSDGKQTESCGNGICCLASFLKHQKLIESSAKIELVDSIVHVDLLHDRIKVFLGSPKNIYCMKKLKISYRTILYHQIHTGVPHVVLFVEDVKKVSVKTFGKKLRYHKDFFPQGTNVNFASIENKGAISVRTYERGVEEETLACGTGACAVALIASIVYNFPSPINVYHPGGMLEVHFQKKSDSFENVAIVGQPQKTFYGELTGNLEMSLC